MKTTFVLLMLIATTAGAFWPLYFTWSRRNLWMWPLIPIPHATYLLYIINSDTGHPEAAMGAGLEAVLILGALALFLFNSVARLLAHVVRRARAD